MFLKKNFTDSTHNNKNIHFKLLSLFNKNKGVKTQFFTLETQQKTKKKYVKEK